MARDRKAHGVRRNESLWGLDTGHPAVGDAQALDLAVLDDVDTGRRRGACVSPRHGIVPHGSTAGLQEPPEHRVASVIEIRKRHPPGDLRAVERLRVHAEQPHLVRAAREEVALRLGVEEVERAALAHHSVEIELLLEPLPQPERELVEADVAGVEVIGADDGGVAADVAEPDGAPLQHRDIRDAVLGGEVEGGREPMSAATDDDDAVARSRGGFGPGSRPTALTAQALAQQPPEGIAAAGGAFSSRWVRARLRRIHEVSPS